MGQIQAQQDKLRESANKFLVLEMDLIALNGKRPLDKGWTDTNEVNYTAEGIAHAIREGHNIGHRIGESELIIDVDPKNGGLKSWLALCRAVPALPWLDETVLTPGGGFHVYTTLPGIHTEDLRLSKTLRDYPGIDFLKSGNQVVIPGSVGSNGVAYKWAPQAELGVQDIPEGLYERLTAGNPHIGAMSHPDAEARAVFYEQNGWGILNARELGDLLKMLNPKNFRDYPRWFSLMAACHFSTGGESEAEDAFAAWATLDPLYADATPKIALHWASLSKEGSNIGGKPITTMTLIHEFDGDRDWGQVEFIISRLGRRLRDTVTFGPTDGSRGTDSESPSDKLQRWLDKLAAYTDDGKIVSEFMPLLAESPDLLPGQREVVFLKIKQITGVGLGTLREDFMARSTGVGSFLENASNNRGTVTQAMAVASVIAKFGGRPMFMFCQGSFHRWACNGRWEPETDMTVQQTVMSVMEEISFPSITSGAINSIGQMVKIKCLKEDDIWERGAGGKSDATVSRDEYSAHLAPMLNLEDGELHLDTETGQWSLKRHSPKSYRRVVVPIRYEAGRGKACPVWEKFIDEALWSIDDEELNTRKDQLAVFIIYSMLESMPWLKKSIYLYGKPDSGKSVILDVIHAMLGKNNTSALTITQLGSRFAPSNLVGKLANLAGEIARSEMISDGTFKSLVSGDSVMMEKKGQDGFSFQNKSVFWFSGNNLPRSRDKSGAIESRMLYLPFDWSCPPERRDDGLRAKLIAEMDAVFAWALERFTPHYLDDHCVGISNTITEGMQRVMDEWKTETDPARVWMQDRLKFAFTDVDRGTNLVESAAFKQASMAGCSEFIPFVALYADYKKWCKDTGHIPLTDIHLGKSLHAFSREAANHFGGKNRQLYQEMIKPGRDYVRGDQVRGWFGVRLRPWEQFDWSDYGAGGEV